MPPYAPGTVANRPAPYGTRPSLFTVRNAKAAYNLGKKIGNAYNRWSAKPKGTPIAVKHTVTRKKRVSGKGYKRVHKDKITSKHAKKAIQAVVKAEMNKEIELKRSVPIYADVSAGISHRVIYVQELTKKMAQGDGEADFTGDRVHVTSVRVKGWIYEQNLATNRGLPTRIEFYVVQKKGGWGTLANPTWGGTDWGIGVEDSFVQSDTPNDNSVDGRFAVLAPQKRRYTVISKRIIRPRPSLKSALGSTENPVRATAFNFTLKVDKRVTPLAAMTGEESSDMPRLFLLMRAFQGEQQTYGGVVAGTAQFHSQVYFRDG